MMPYRLQRALTETRQRLAVARGMAHLDANDPSGTVLLAGSGRSGTTWLGRIINHGNVYRDVFEPFHPERVEALRGWPVMRYLSPDNEDADTTRTIKRLLAGHVRSAWTDQYNRKHLAGRRLIKAIRANLLLGWIRYHCPEAKLLYALRHPCAVAYSRIKLGWDTHLDQLLDQPALVRDHLGPFQETIERIAFAGDAWDKHLAMWCIENLVPLRQLAAGDMHVLFYERFCESFDDETPALFAFLNRETPRGVERAYGQRSAHFRRDSAILRGTSLVGDWQSRVSTNQIDRALALMDKFGLGHLYNERALPRCDHNSVFIDTQTHASTNRPTDSPREAA